ncbi:hypothetical protein LCGC14_0535650 [marine sediment metagenome]|uniref:Uncharacterized protein n=1 Tax=marine sediment metagenome TaxID=412755 RepID=A0A0F9UFT8_9ZZZZ
MKSKVLFDKSPLVIDRDLAQIVGLHEAIIVQQIHYWLVGNEERTNNFRDGFYWTFNSYREWQQTFNFWSARTIQRLILDLQQKGILVVGNFNRLKIDKTKWYRIDYDKLSSWSPTNDIKDELSSTQRQTGTMVTKEVLDHGASLSSPLPETNAKTTTETNIKERIEKGEPSPPLNLVEQIFIAMRSYYGYPDKIDQDPIPNYGKEGKSIKRMLERGLTPKQILECWIDKCKKAGIFKSMVYVNEDIRVELPVDKFENQKYSHIVHR